MAVHYRHWLFSFITGLSISACALAASTITNAYLPLMMLGCALSLASVFAWSKHRISSAVAVPAQVRTDTSPKRILSLPLNTQALPAAKTAQMREMFDAV